MRRLAGITTVLALVGLGLLLGHFGEDQGTQASHGTGGAEIIVALDTVSGPDNTASTIGSIETCFDLPATAVSVTADLVVAGFVGPDSVSGIGTWQAEVRYNDAVLGFPAVAFLKVTGSTSGPVGADLNTNGLPDSVTIGASITAGSGPTGDGVLARLTFPVTAWGTSILDLIDPTQAAGFLLQDAVSAVVTPDTFGDAALLPEGAPADPPPFTFTPPLNPPPEEADDVRYTRSTDGGTTFEAPRVVSSEVDIHRIAHVAASGSDVHLLYDVGDKPREVINRASTDGGLTFGVATNISNNLTDSSESDLAVNGSSVHVVLEEDHPWEPICEGDETYYSRSTDGGLTFEPIKVISNTHSSHSRDPDIAVSGTTLHVVQEDNTPTGDEIFYERSTDNGATWGSARNLSTDLEGSAEPTIAVSGNVVHAAWQGGGEIFYKRSVDGGVTWDAVAQNLSNNLGDSKASVLAVDGSVVHIVWCDKTPGNGETFYKRSTDGGVTWSATPLNVSNNPGDCKKPFIAAGGGSVHIVWDDKTPGNLDVFYARSTDGGATFGAAVNLSNNPFESSHPGVAVSGTSVHVSWQDLRLAPQRGVLSAVTLGAEVYEFGRGSDEDLWYRKRTNPWGAWTPLGGVLSSKPAAVVAGADLYVFVRGSADDLWYRKLSSGVWGAWQSLGGIIEGTPAPVAISENDLYVFVRGSGNNLWYRHWDGISWGPWQPLDGVLTASPSAVVAGTDVYVFGRGAGHDLWYRKLSSGVWGGWQPLGGTLTSIPSPAAIGAEVYVTVRGLDGDVWYRHWTGSIWEDWQPLFGFLEAGPVAVTAGNDLYVLGTGGGGDLWYRRLSSGIWSDWASLGGILTAPASPAAFGANDLYVFVRASGNDVWYRRWNGAVWEDWQPLGGILTTGRGSP